MKQIFFKIKHRQHLGCMSTPLCITRFIFKPGYVFYFLFASEGKEIFKNGSTLKDNIMRILILAMLDMIY